MAVTPLSLLRSCFGVRPQSQGGAAVAAPPARPVSVAAAGAARMPASGSQLGVFARFKQLVSRAFQCVACCGFRRNPQDDTSSGQGGSPRAQGADSSYLASVEASGSTAYEASPRTPLGSDAELTGPVGDDASHATSFDASRSDVNDTESYESETFSSYDSGYSADSGSLRDPVSDSEVSENEASGLNLARLDLSNRDLRQMDLRGANLEGAILEGVNLEGVDLTGANLRRANLKGANLAGAILHKTDMCRANLEGANLRHACCRYAKLQQSNLDGVDLRSARYVWQTDFAGANLKGARLDGAALLQNRCVLSKAHLDQEGVNALRNEIETLSPAGLCNSRKLQRLLDDGTNGASILTSIDAAPVSPADKLMMMESLVSKLGEAYRTGNGGADSLRFVSHFIDKHPWYEQQSAAISAFPAAVPVAEGTDPDRSEAAQEVSRQNDRPRQITHPRVASLQRTGSSPSLARPGRSGSMSDSTTRPGRSGSMSELSSRASQSGTAAEFSTRVGRSGSASELSARSELPMRRSPSPSAFGGQIPRSGSFSAFPSHGRSGSTASESSMDSMASRGGFRSDVEASIAGATQANELAQLATAKGLAIVVGASSKSGSDVPHLSGTLDVNDPDAIKLLRMALQQGVDFDHIELTGQIADHTVARQFLELLDDTPPYSMPKNIDVSILDVEQVLDDDVRSGKTDELWERTITFSHLQDHGVGVASTKP